MVLVSANTKAQEHPFLSLVEMKHVVDSSTVRLPLDRDVDSIDDLTPSADELRVNAESRFGDLTATGPNIRRRLKVGYFTPIEHYEVIVRKLISSHTRWLDVGCGCTPFPGNNELARELGQRCSRLVGVDPDDTIQENSYVHETAQCVIEDFESDSAFDVITMRMVCEHVNQPLRVIEKLGQLTTPYGRVVVLTPSVFAISSLLARATPVGLHRAVKARVWNTRDEDTFPVRFLMNTRRRLHSLMANAGFEAEYFRRLPDASLLWKYPRLHAAELTCWRMLPAALDFVYPDACLLGVYRKVH